MNRTGKAVVSTVVVVALVVVAGVGMLLHRLNGKAAMTQPADLSAITMVDSKSGWVLTKDDQIFRTADGGATWTDVSIFQAPMSGQTAPVAGACFLDEKTAFVAVNAGTDNQPQVAVYRTSDGGATWDRASITTKLEWEKNDIGGLMVSFPDASNGYLMITGTPGAGQMAKSLYRTTDGGKTFAFSGDITGMTDASGKMSGVAGYPTGMTFATPEVGYVTCSYSAYTFVLMFKTTDGGLNWKLFSLPVPSAYAGLSPATDYYADAYAPVFFGSERKDGIIMLDFVRNGAQMTQTHTMQCYSTTDGGDTWTLASVSPKSDLKTYSFITTATGWGIDEAGKLFMTTDGGSTWMAAAGPK
ncbi:MAG: WD40/YVTN/BNR-like repeat-containing protein [Candidatus Cryosericum sp.]